MFVLYQIMLSLSCLVVSRQHLAVMFLRISSFYCLLARRLLSDDLRGCFFVQSAFASVLSTLSTLLFVLPSTSYPHGVGAFLPKMLALLVPF